MSKISPSVKEFLYGQAGRRDGYYVEIYKIIDDGATVGDIQEALRSADYLGRMIELEYGEYTIFKLNNGVLEANITEDLYHKLEWLDNSNLIK